MSQPPGRWLQRELLRRLMLPVLGIVLLMGIASSFYAEELVEEVFDRWLLDAVSSLASQVQFRDGIAQVQLSPQAEAVLTYDAVDRVTYEIMQGDRHVLGRSGLPRSGGDEHSYGGGRAYDGEDNGVDVRIGVTSVTGSNGEKATVWMSETRQKRDLAMRSLMLVLLLMGVLVLAAALVIGTAVRRTVRPLEQMAAMWNERSHASLEPMPVHEVPHELMPFALALNDLLARVRELLLRERHLAATAAHQLRTPLAGLQLGLARAAEYGDLDSTRAALVELQRTTQRAARMVQQLLALGRLDPEVRGLVELEDVDLVALAREVGEAYMDAAQARQIELSLEAADEHLWVRGQPELLGEALGNVIDNAIRYSPNGARVAIDIDDAPATVVISDSGPGIAPDEADKVFELFVRGRGTTGEGSGLGLAIVKEIATLHGAEAMVDRSPELGGTRFQLRFQQATGAVLSASADTQ